MCNYMNRKLKVPLPVCTIFPQIDATATICFVMGVGAAFVRGQCLFLSACNVSVATSSIAVLGDCSITVLEDC